MDFGGLSGIDYMDRWFGFPIPFTTYYSSLIASLESVGFAQGQTLFGAPYDWRIPTTRYELDESGFNDKFRKLILHAYSVSGNKKVNVITHSLGGLTAVEFFNTMDQQWLDTYVANFIPIAAPWSGSPKSLRTIISGDNFGIEILGINLLNIEAVMKLSRQAGGIVQLVPFPAFYSSNTVFVQNNNKRYTALDFPQLFKDINSPITGIIHQRTITSIDLLKPPNVSTYCIYGIGIKTEVFYNYKNGFENQPEITYSNTGDGTVPIESLLECNDWSKKQSAPVQTKQFNLLGHSDILEDTRVFEYIISILTGKL